MVGCGRRLLAHGLLDSPQHSINRIWRGTHGGKTPCNDSLILIDKTSWISRGFTDQWINSLTRVSKVS